MHGANFRGIRTSTKRRGISHADVVDMRRRRFTRRAPSTETEVSDIVPFYVDVVKELKEKGC
jgi:triacylglycerol lipase